MLEWEKKIIASWRLKWIRTGGRRWWFKCWLGNRFLLCCHGQSFSMLLLCPGEGLLCNPGSLPELFLLSMRSVLFPPRNSIGLYRGPWQGAPLRGPPHVPENQTASVHTKGQGPMWWQLAGSLTFKPGLELNLNVTLVFLIDLTLLELGWFQPRKGQ